MRRPLITALAAAIVLGTVPATAKAPAFKTDAPIAYMRDMSSGAVLFARDADRQIPPASMAKMMTVYVAFDLVKKGEIALDDTVRVSDEAWRNWSGQGSTMFLSAGEEVRISDLLHGIVTLSGNDACVVLAEGLAGSEDAYVDMMNSVARRIGIENSRFGNTTGWPDEGQTLVTARDLATLGIRTVRDFPDLYEEFYGQEEFTWGKTAAGTPITQGNRNPLMGRVRGADGLKTGHTEEAGYGFTGSAEQDGRRIVMVLAGLDSYGGRIDESVRFMNWGFRAWKSKPLFDQGTVVGEAEVQLGGDSSVALVTPAKVAVTLPRASSGDLRVTVRYKGPIKAPIRKGQEIAELVVRSPSMGPQVTPLVAAEAVEEAGFFDHVWNGLRSLFGA